MPQIASTIYGERLKKFFSRMRAKGEQSSLTKPALGEEESGQTGQGSAGWLFLGALAGGVLVKLVFSFFVTIGYDDYHVVGKTETISLTALQEKTLAAGGSLAYVPRQVGGPVCADTPK